MLHSGIFLDYFSIFKFFSKIYKSMIYFWRRFVKSLSRYGNPSHLIFRLYASDLPQYRLPKTAFKCEGAEDGAIETAYSFPYLHIGNRRQVWYNHCGYISGHEKEICFPSMQNRKNTIK